MKSEGNSGPYVGARGARPVPTDTTYRQHRPWCVDCKRTLDHADLDTEGRCERCARAQVMRAAAAERRQVEATTKPPAEGNQGKPTTRSSAPRAKSTSRSTRRARVAGSSTTEKKNPPATRETRPRVAGGPTGPRSTTNIAAIRRLYVDEQRSVPEIARTLGHTPATVRRTLRAAHVALRDDRKTRSGGHPLVRDREVIADVVRRYTGNQTIAQIGDSLQIGRRQITRILHEAGVPVRPPVHLAHPVPDAATQQTMVDRYLAGETLATIARAHQVRSTLVATLVRDRGYTVRSKGAAESKAARIAELETTASEIRAWAVATGRLEPGGRGLLAVSVIEAYAARTNTDPNVLRSVRQEFAR